MLCAAVVPSVHVSDGWPFFSRPCLPPDMMSHTTDRRSVCECAAQVYTLSVPDPLNPVHGRFPMHDCDFVHELVQRLTSKHGHGQHR